MLALWTVAKLPILTFRFVERSEAMNNAQCFSPFPSFLPNALTGRADLPQQDDQHEEERRGSQHGADLNRAGPRGDQDAEERQDVEQSAERQPRRDGRMEVPPAQGSQPRRATRR